MAKLVMLGTGNAMVTKCYNTCFLIETEQGHVMVDAGGGNTILAQLEKAGTDWTKIHALFLTHAHTDHILGCIWVLRKMNTMMKKGKYTEEFRIYGFAENLEYLRYSCEFLVKDVLNEKIRLIPISGGDSFMECGMKFEAMDIHSTKKKQLGFRAIIPEQNRELSLVCLGDEPYHESCEQYAKNADWLLSEAFCLNSEQERFHPYEKHHSTAYDAGKVAKMLNVKNLILYHTEDSNLEHRAERYAREAEQEYSGNIFVPRDLEIIPLT